MKTTASAARQSFLARNRLAAAECRPLTGDASGRQYFRITRENRRKGSVILMDAGPTEKASTTSFLAIANWLTAAGFSAPRILDHDLDNGLLLLEDLGDNLLSRLPQGKTSDAAMMASVDFLRELHLVDPPAELEFATILPRHDLGVYVPQARIVLDFYAPQRNSSAERAEFDQILTSACLGLKQVRDVVVLRDFHAGNLIWLPRRSSSRRIGLLDFQDALVGHPAYDLVSLTQDARRDIAPGLEDSMVARYVVGCDDPAAFRRDYALLGAQRQIRILGIFARIARVDSRTGYLKLIPRVWRHLRNDLAHPDLAALADWVARTLPEPTGEYLEKLAVRA